jgi:hypothetical protein
MPIGRGKTDLWSTISPFTVRARGSDHFTRHPEGETTACGNTLL